VDLYFYTIAKVPAGFEEGEWISASDLPVETPILAFTKVVDGPENVRIFENTGGSGTLIYEGSLDALFLDISEVLLPLVKSSIGDYPKESEEGLAQIICIQDDADYDLDEQWQYSLGQDEIACPVAASGKLIVSVTPYYSVEVASPSDISARPPKLTNSDSSICEEHMLVSVFIG
jgi:hypothetical protein